MLRVAFYNAHFELPWLKMRRPTRQMRDITERQTNVKVVLSFISGQCKEEDSDWGSTEEED